MAIASIEDFPSSYPYTPFLSFKKSKLVENCKSFKKLFPKAGIFYSVKANSHPDILQIINKQKIGFDVASWGEIELLRNLNVDPDNIVFSAPTKLPKDITRAYGYGIEIFATDSFMETEKIAALAPNSKVLLRVVVSNEGSEWPLIRKFGVKVEDTIKHFKYIQSLGLTPHGIAFHVGSQNLSPKTWEKALKRVYKLWEDLDKKGYHLEIVNIGGGFPIRYTKDVPSLREIASVINKNFKKLFKNGTKLFIEPGRRMVGNTGVLTATVVNRATREKEEWLYLDVGVYHGLQETIEGFEYEIKTDKKTRKKIPYVLAGPTCDSTDNFMAGVKLPHDLTFGDRLHFQNAGAYTNSYEYYNGLEYPEVIIS